MCAQATNTKAKNRRSRGAIAPAAAASSSAATAPARPSTDAAPARPGWRRCRSSCPRRPPLPGCADAQTGCGPAGRQPGPPRTWWYRRPRPSAAAHHPRRPDELGPRLATIDGIAPTWSPRLARTRMVSTLARVQSSRPCSTSRSNTCRWSRSNFPALGPLGQAAPAGRRRAAAKHSSRQQPPRGRGAGHVNNRGKAVGARRTRCRPPYGGRGGAGSNGSTSAHS
jgi:hypothetical protein